MSLNEIKYVIDNLKALRSNREKAAQSTIDQPGLLQFLITLALTPDYNNHHKAAWTLEIVLEQHLDWLNPHLDFYGHNLQHIKNPSAVRLLSKINQWLAYDYVKNNKTNTQNIQAKHMTQIVEIGFDWMIQNYPVATQAYTMDTLFYFGLLKNPDLEWVHDNLKAVILQHISEKSSAYKAHGKKIIANLRVMNDD